MWLLSDELCNLRYPFEPVGTLPGLPGSGAGVLGGDLYRALPGDDRWDSGNPQGRGGLCPHRSGLSRGSIGYILSDTGTSWVLSSRESRSSIPENYPGKVIELDGQWEQISSYPSTPLQASIHPDQLIYVIYTSGSTGRPKGVMIEHRNVSHLCFSLSKAYDFGQEEVILQFANYVFDASVEQLFLALTHGFPLLLAPPGSWLDRKAFVGYLIENRVSHIDTTPSLLQEYSFEALSSLKRIVSGGEALSSGLYAKLRDQYPDIAIYNAYGSTEATVTNTLKQNGSNIGRPVANSSVYVLGDNGDLSPVGVMGGTTYWWSGLSKRVSEYARIDS